MIRSLGIYGCFCLALCVSGLAPGEEKTPKPIVAQYEARYQTFVERFRARSGAAKRLQLVKQTSQELNTLLAPHVRLPAMKKLLPKLVDARLVDLGPTFVSVIDEHPDRHVRALALFCFAKYAGNNNRRKECAVSLAFLKRRYGSLKYQDSTFAQAADEALYFFNHLAVGRPAPATVSEDVDGTLFSLEDYRGKVVMLRFWGHWCPACRAMYGFERKLVKKYRNQPFALIGVNSDSRDVCREAQRNSRLTWRSMWDGGNTRGPVSMIYRISHWPTIVVIDAKGIIRYRSRGLAEPQLTKVIERLVKEAEQANALSSTERNQPPRG